MISTRRGFISGLGALIAAPAIVRVASIMPVSARGLALVRTSIPIGAWRLFGRSPMMDALPLMVNYNIVMRRMAQGNGAEYMLKEMAYDPALS